MTEKIKNHPFITIILVIAIAAGAYFLLNKEKTYSYSFSDFSSSTVFSGVKKIGEKGADFVSESISKAANVVADKTGEIVSGAVTAVKQEAFKILKNTVNKELDNLGEDLKVGDTNKQLPMEEPSAAGQASAINIIAGSPSNNINSHPEIKFTVKTGVLSYFTIQNVEGETIIYDVNWKDGATDKNSLSKGSMVTLSHSWSKEGDFLVEFNITASGVEKNYIIPVTVF
ncbi:MAG: hypothetical protein PHP03_00290 [Candidatus Pacebacteria bacterium]|nr:hypothetical protein [Candidatus Paceibacterota bacterium]